MAKDEFKDRVNMAYNGNGMWYGELAGKFDEIFGVTHWQYFPQPPKKGAEQ